MHIVEKCAFLLLLNFRGVFKQEMYMKSFGVRFLLVAFALLSVNYDVWAEKPAQPIDNNDDKDLSPSVVASEGQYFGRHTVDSNTAPEEDNVQSPVVGAIERIGGNKCVVKLTNNSEKSSYSVKYVVKTIDPRGGESQKSFSSTLNPNGSVERRVSCGKDDNIQVQITSGKKL